jgi:SAM-dependent methyltransferase
MSDPKTTVQSGYDLVSMAYRGDDECPPHYEEWLAVLMASLRPGSAVLDLGCGCGVPVAASLSPHFAVTGVDLSEGQIRRARALVPDATFIRDDMTRIDFPPSSFSGIVALYSIIHVPLAEQPALISRLGSWLADGGLFLGTVGYRAWTGTEEDWLGVRGARMYWSHARQETYLNWLQSSGLEPQSAHVVPEGDGGHTLVVARKTPKLTPRTSQTMRGSRRRATR